MFKYGNFKKICSLIVDKKRASGQVSQVKLSFFEISMKDTRIVCEDGAEKT